MWMMSRFDGAKKEIPDFNWLTWLPEAKQAAITMFLTDCQVIREPLNLMTLSGDSTYDIPTFKAILTPSSFFITSVMESSIFNCADVIYLIILHPVYNVLRLPWGASNYCVSLFTCGEVRARRSTSQFCLLLLLPGNKRLFRNNGIK